MSGLVDGGVILIVCLRRSPQSTDIGWIVHNDMNAAPIQISEVDFSGAKSSSVVLFIRVENDIRDGPCEHFTMCLLVGAKQAFHFHSFN